MPLDQVLREAFAEAAADVERCLGRAGVGALCDVVAVGNGSECVRLNADKTLAWLNGKVDRLAAFVRDGMSRRDASERLAGKSAMFVLDDDLVEERSPNANANDNAASASASMAAEAEAWMTREAARVATQLVVDYLPPTWRSRLIAARGFTEREVMSGEPLPRVSSASAPPTSSSSSSSSSSTSTSQPTNAETTSTEKKSWEEMNGYTAAASSTTSASNPSAAAPAATTATAAPPPAKKAKPTATTLTLGQRKLAAVNTKGMKSITSFFAPKPAAPPPTAE